MKKVLFFLGNYGIFLVILGAALCILFLNGFFEEELTSIMNSENYRDLLFLGILFIFIVLFMVVLRKIAKIEHYYQDMYEERAKEVERLRESNEKKDSTIINLNTIHQNILSRVDQINKKLKEHTG